VVNLIASRKKTKQTNKKTYGVEKKLIIFLNLPERE